MPPHEVEPGARYRLRVLPLGSRPGPAQETRLGCYAAVAGRPGVLGAGSA